jgi:hypothetical protein
MLNVDYTDAFDISDDVYNFILHIRHFIFELFDFIWVCFIVGVIFVLLVLGVMDISHAMLSTVFTLLCSSLSIIFISSCQSSVSTQAG